MILTELEELGVVPDFIVLTHGDPDHIASAAFLRERTGAQAGKMARTPTPPVDDWLEPGDRVGRLEVIATPGHTPGHVSLRVGTTLIAGDAFDTGPGRNRERPGILTHDREQARASIRMLAAAGLDAGFSGHGRPCRELSGQLRRLVEPGAAARLADRLRCHRRGACAPVEPYLSLQRPAPFHDQGEGTGGRGTLGVICEDGYSDAGWTKRPEARIPPAGRHR